MMLIVRFHPRYETEKLWDCVEARFSNYPMKDITPLYMSQQEDHHFVSTLFEVKNVDSVARFLIDETEDCDEIDYTRTITLLRPAFFSMPKGIRDDMKRFMISVSVDPAHYHSVYKKLVELKRPEGLHFTYVSYSFGEDDILISTVARSWKDIRKFVEERLNKVKGIRSSHVSLICRSKRLTSRERWIEHQKEYSVERVLGRKEEGTYDYDWTFIDHCALHGAMPDEI